MWHRAKVLSRRKLSPSVTGLTLQITDHQHQPSITNTNTNNSNFTFLPGQWVDFKPVPSSSWTPPERGNIGGYSITSIPSSLPRLELAIQVSRRHPVAHWVTNHCVTNDLVDVRVGGNFTYHESFEEESSSNEEQKQQTTKTVQQQSSMDRVLFVAGGVGINPPFSMIQQWVVDQKQKHTTSTKSKAVLLYSCGKTDGFLFLKELGKLVQNIPDQLRVICTTTKQHQSSLEDDLQKEVDGNIVFQEGRIDLSKIRGAVQWLNECGNAVDTNSSTKDERLVLETTAVGVVADAVFVCGPPGMPESITKILEEKFVQSEDSVHFEKWW